MTVGLSIIIILLTAVGQVLLKKGANLSKKLFFNRYVFLGYSTFIIVILFSTILMKYLQLKYIAIIVSFNYLVTMIFATILLKEKITRKTVLACIIVVLGSVVFNL